MSGAQNPLAGQLIRYGMGGIGLALAFSLVYEAVLQRAPSGPQAANFAGFLATTALGYLVHSRWSFRDHDVRGGLWRCTGRYVVVNACSFAMNIGWVWLLVTQWGLSSHLPLLPILGLTPWLGFHVNRRWTFAQPAPRPGAAAA